MSEQTRPFDIRRKNRLNTQTNDSTINETEMTLLQGVIGNTQSSVPAVRSGTLVMSRLGSWICVRKVEFANQQDRHTALHGPFPDSLAVFSKVLAFYPAVNTATLTTKELSNLPLIPGLQVKLTESSLPIFVVRPEEEGSMHRILQKPKGCYREWISADDKSKVPVTTDTSVVVGEGPGGRPTWQIVFSPQSILERTVQEDDCTISIRTEGQLFGIQNLDHKAIRDGINYQGGKDLIEAAFKDAVTLDNTTVKTEPDDPSSQPSSSCGSVRIKQEPDE